MAESLQKALVSGASGFIGWHLIRALLARNVDVVALVRETSDTWLLRDLDVELRYADLNAPTSLREAAVGCDTVFHLAGLTKALSPETLMRVNAQGTADFARACQSQSNPPIFVFVSSLAAAGPTSPGNPLLEWDVAEPVSNYGRSKLAGEESLRQFSREMPITVIRPPIVFGEADPGTLQMYKALSRTRVHVIPGYARQLFSVIYAADLAEFCLAAAEQGERLEPDFDHGQGLYFVESDHRFGYGELGAALGRALGHRVTLPLPLPHFAVRWAGAISDMVARSSGTPNYMSADKAREATAGSWICDADKAVRQLEIARPTALPEKFARTAAWYHEHKWL